MQEPILATLQVWKNNPKMMHAVVDVNHFILLQFAKRKQFKNVSLILKLLVRNGADKE
jgi:hypothetical protein